MYSLKKVIKIESENHNSFWFKVVNNRAYVIINRCLFVYEKENRKLLKEYPENNIKIIKAKECVLAGNDVLGYDLIFSDDSIHHKQELKGLEFPFDSISDQVYFFLYDINFERLRSGVFDTKTQSFITEREAIVNIVYAENGIFITDELDRIDSQGKKVWQFGDSALLQTHKIAKIIGIQGKQMIIAFSDHLLLSLDLESGQVVHTWQELKGFEVGQFYKDVLPNPANFVLDGNANKLIGVFHTYYFEIDLITKQIRYENLSAELENHSINSFRPMGNNPFTADHLFLTGHVSDKEMPDIDFNCVLALNRHTRNVDWSYTFRDTSIGINIPQITDIHLYQIDVENNLYIFAKEDGI